MRFGARVLVLCLPVAAASAQQPAMTRLPADVLDVAPPSARVRGLPGAMTVLTRGCQSVSVTDARRRIVDVAAQEWGFFGFRLAAASDGEDAPPDETSAASPADTARDGRRWRRPPLPPAEAGRVATSIAGYWAVTPEGSWIVARQNDRWKGPDGIGPRWNAPWSAAFISWVMCEAGLGTAAEFHRAVAHHTYIDQAIRARDGRAPQAAFVAYDVGETAIAPGDLLCSSRRPAYRSLAERRRQMGVGARSHCDVVVKVDDARQRILAIGGNVRGVVSLKVLPAQRREARPLTLVPNDTRRVFAHLKLRTGAVGADALDSSPTVRASQCGVPATAAPVASMPVAAAGLASARC